MELLFRGLASSVWENEIWNNYNPAGATPHPKTTLTEELETFWNERTKYSIPNSYSYIFGYNPHHILRAKNFNILQGNFSSLMGKPALGENKEEFGPEVDEYLKCIIPEQRYLSAYVIRRSVADIFFKDWEFFRTNQHNDKGILEPTYALYMDITVIDYAEKRWHAHQIIEPIVGAGGQFDLLYHSTVQLIRQTSIVPFRFRVGHRTGLGGDVNKIKDMNESLYQNLQKNIMKELGFTERELNLYRYYLLGYDSKQIADKFKIKDNNQNSICLDVNKKIKKNFPELAYNYAYFQGSNQKQGIKSHLNPKIVTPILADLGLIRRPNLDSERRTLS